MITHDNVFGILADPTRLRLVAALRTGERSVTDLVREVGIQQSGVSRHLRILQEGGFVMMRPYAQMHLYSLRPEPFRELEDWLAQYRRLWEKRRFSRSAVAPGDA